MCPNIPRLNEDQNELEANGELVEERSEAEIAAFIRYIYRLRNELVEEVTVRIEVLRQLEALNGPQPDMVHREQQPNLAQPSSTPVPSTTPTENTPERDNIPAAVPASDHADTAADDASAGARDANLATNV